MAIIHIKHIICIKPLIVFHIFIRIRYFDCYYTNYVYYVTYFLSFQSKWNTSGLLANYDIVVFDYDIGIYRYGLRYRSSVLMTTTSCFSRYRVFHDIVNHDIEFHDIVIHDVVIHDIVKGYTISWNTRLRESRYRVFHDIVNHDIVIYTMSWITISWNTRYRETRYRIRSRYIPI